MDRIPLADQSSRSLPVDPPYHPICRAGTSTDLIAHADWPSLNEVQHPANSLCLAVIFMHLTSQLIVLAWHNVTAITWYAQKDAMRIGYRANSATILEAFISTDGLPHTKQGLRKLMYWFPCNQISTRYCQGMSNICRTVGVHRAILDGCWSAQLHLEDGA